MDSCSTSSHSASRSPGATPRCASGRPATPTPQRSSGWPRSTPAAGPRGDVLIAEVGDELWAAVSLKDGHHIADPLRPSADAVLMLAQRGRQLRRDERRGAHGRARLRFA